MCETPWEGTTARFRTEDGANTLAV
jgi:hypothetical protein